MSSYRILLAEDHVLVRQGIKKIIQEDEELQVIGEAGDGFGLLELMEKNVADMVIVDISMPRIRGLELIKYIKKLYPTVKVLVLTMHKSKDYLYEAMSNGADGYLLKEDADTSLHSAIKTIRRGNSYISRLLFT